MLNTAEREPIVWVIANMAHDYSPALIFGKSIRKISTLPLTPNAPNDGWNDEAIEQIVIALRDYRAGFDYVVPTGNPVLILLVGSILRMKGDTHNYLGWDNKTGRYFQYRITLKVPQHESKI